MSWAGRRQTLYSLSAAAFLFLIAAAISYVYLVKPATCTDGTQNGSERGIDCGGSCARICEDQAQAPSVVWTRSFMVAPGVYTAAAYIENRNVDAYARNVAYKFKLFDARNVLIAERRGITAIASTRNVPIIETGIATGNRVPARAYFEFEETPMWQTGTMPRLDVTQSPIDEVERRVGAFVSNDTNTDLENVPVAVVLYDASGTAQAASQSMIKRLRRGTKEEVVFTWPLPFAAPIVKAEIIALPLP